MAIKLTGNRVGRWSATPPICSVSLARPNGETNVCKMQVGSARTDRFARTGDSRSQGPKGEAATRKAASSKRGYLGVALNGNTVAYIGLGLPAEKAGVKIGDGIIRIDGEKVASQKDITAAISRKSAGDTIRITLSRGIAEREVTVTLGDADHATDERAAIQPSTRPAGPPWTKGSGAPPTQDRQCVALKLPDSAAHSDLYGVSFPDALNGWIVGAKGLCLRTTDGGDRWTRLDLDSRATLRRPVPRRRHGLGVWGWNPKAPSPLGLNCHFVSGRSALAGTLLHTTDGGTTWTTVWLPTNFNAPSLASTPRGAIVGTSGGDDHLDGDLRRVEQLDEGFMLSSTSAYRATFALAALNEDRWIAVGSPVSVFFFSFTSSPLRSQSKCRILWSGWRKELGARKRQRGKRLLARRCLAWSEGCGGGWRRRSGSAQRGRRQELATGCPPRP